MAKKYKDNYGVVTEMRQMLDKIDKINKGIVNENFIMPEEETFDSEETYDAPRPQGKSEEDVVQTSGNEITGIEKELTQIRKIALSVINRLADQPTSPQYDTMKKIWNMVDKAIEQPNSVNKSAE